MPLILDILALDPADRRSQLVIDFFLLPKRMLIKLGLVEPFEALAARIMPIWRPCGRRCSARSRRSSFSSSAPASAGSARPASGARSGPPAFARPSAELRRGRRGRGRPAWRLLGWCVVAGLGIPFVLTTQPYVDTINFYLTGLYVMWIFTAAALVRFAQRHGTAGRAAVVWPFSPCCRRLCISWAASGTTPTRPPRASLSHGELLVAQYLKTTDPETTVLLHDRPLAPSLMTVISERRIVLGWDVRYSAVGGEDRLNDVNFFLRVGRWRSRRGVRDPAPLSASRTCWFAGKAIACTRPCSSGLTLLMRSGDVSLYAVPVPRGA